MGVILALSGVEAVANITGVMKADADSTAGKTESHAHRHESDRAGRDRSGHRHRAARLGHALAAARVSRRTCSRTKKTCSAFSPSTTDPSSSDPRLGQIFGIIVGAIFGLLLFSAVNTAIVALIGVIYMMAQDGEMPRQLARLNRHGVPKIPLFIAVGIPIVILAVTKQFEGLAGLYAIGVVGAIAVNLGACTFNKRLDLRWYERGIMGLTFVVLAAVELTIAAEQTRRALFRRLRSRDRLWIARLLAQISGLKTVTVSRGVAAMVHPELANAIQPRLEEGQKIMVAARGITPVLGFALDEAQLRKAVLCVLFVKEIAVYFSAAPTALGKSRWQDDPEANAIMSLMLKTGCGARRVCSAGLCGERGCVRHHSRSFRHHGRRLPPDWRVPTHRAGSSAPGSVVTNVAAQLPEDITW